MQETSVRSPGETENMVRKYGNMLFRICFIVLGNKSDAEDAVQDTVVRYMQKAPAFENPEHEKAWLIKVASNRCRDMRRFWRRHPQAELDTLESAAPNPESCGILEALMAIPEKFRVVMTLHYAEEYRVEEIASMIGKSSSAVKMRLQKGRKLLEEIYRKEYL